MFDAVYTRFLEQQLERGMELAAASDLLDLHPMPGSPTTHYIAHYTCKGLVRDDAGNAVEANAFDVGIWLSRDHMQRPNSQILTWISPGNAMHPNINAHHRLICPGNIPATTTLDFILQQIFDVITYNKLTMNELDALDPVACAWSRRHQNLFPVDTRPLRRQESAIQAEVIG